MYKIDDEFRPRGRVFMKATRESQQQQQHQSSTTTTTSERGEPIGSNVISVPIRKSSLKKGPPITTNLDDRRIQFQHEVKHEKTIEALITEYPPGDDYRPPGTRSYSSDRQSRYEHHTSTSPQRLTAAIPAASSLNDVSREVMHYSTNNSTNNGYDVTDNVHQSMQAITRNKRSSTETLGNSFESKKLSQRATDGHRRITTHIVRKMTTMSRAEENAQTQDLVHTTQTNNTEIGYMTTQAIESKVWHLMIHLIFYSLRKREKPPPLLPKKTRFQKKTQIYKSETTWKEMIFFLTKQTPLILIFFAHQSVQSIHNISSFRFLFFIIFITRFIFLHHTRI